MVEKSVRFARAPRDLTDEWLQFLSENPTIGQAAIPGFFRSARYSFPQVALNVCVFTSGLSLGSLNSD